MGIDDPAHLGGHQIGGLIPRDFDERLTTAPFSSPGIAGRPIEPAFADRRALHPKRRTIGLEHRQPDRRRRTIVAKRTKTAGSRTGSLNFVGAPVGGGELESERGGTRHDECLQPRVVSLG